jgi:quinol monooxygenase YgiN
MKVILRLSAKPDELKRVLIGLAAPTRKEPGCLSYEIFQNLADPCDFTFVEEWSSDAALDAHRQAPLGGRASPIQTQWLGRGDVTIPRKLARPRFTTTYYEQFLDLAAIGLARSFRGRPQAGARNPSPQP